MGGEIGKRKKRELGLARDTEGETATGGTGVRGVCGDSEDPSLEKNRCRVAFVRKRRMKYTSTRGSFHPLIKIAFSPAPPRAFPDLST